MELAHYLMMASMKRRQSSSWEEKAFAEDIRGIGMVWPPRSYACSFCHREFRSAQALGGHMNVHRRDRARLKHSSIIVSNPNPNPNSRVSDGKEEDGAQMGWKRVKVSNTMTFPIQKCSSKEVVVVEELDLELRLGNAAKLK